jgi:hypothetical protein
VLNLIGTVAMTAAIAVCFVAIAATMPVQLAQRLALAAVAGAWIGFAASVAGAGGLANPAAIPILFVTPIATVVALASFSSAIRAVLLAMPMPVLIGLNAIRTLGTFFLVLAAAGRLGGPFPQSAGWGDIITGIFAIPLVWAVARGAPNLRGLIGAWNAFGTLDLIVAVTLGTMSANGSPLQIIHAGAGSGAVYSLPWSLIPTVLVPFFLIVHGIIFAQLHARVTKNIHASSGPVGAPVATTRELGSSSCPAKCCAARPA